MLPFDGTIKKSITIPTTMLSQKKKLKILLNFTNLLKKILENKDMDVEDKIELLI